MLGIISRILKDLASGITAVEKWVLKLVHSVYSYFDKLFGELRHAVNDVWAALVSFGRAIRKYVGQIYTFARWIVTKLVPGVIHWALKQLDALARDISGVIHWATGWITRLANDIISAIRNITTWIIKHIYDPLAHDFITAWHWITHEGALVYRLITHPDMLAGILAKYLWGAWLGLFHKFGPQIARYLVTRMPNMVGTITKAMEDFIANLL